MFATSYVIIMAIAGLTAKQMGQSTLADETYAALATIPAATYLWREFRKRNLILTCAIIYFLLTLFSGAVQFAIFHYASFTQMAVGTVLDAKVFIIYMFLSFVIIGKGGQAAHVRFMSTLRVLFVLSLGISILFLRDLFGGGSSIQGFALYRGLFQLPVPVGPFTHKFLGAQMDVIAIACATAIYLYERRIIYLFAMLWFTVLLLTEESAKELTAPIAAGAVIALDFVLARGVNQINRVYRMALVGVAGLFAVGMLLLAAMGTLSERVNVYYMQDSVRSHLYTASVQIALKHFPIGTGPGTFASQPTIIKHYSPLYMEYGFQYTYGSSPDYPDYLMDTWWPKVLAESGVFGFLAYFSTMVVPLWGMIRQLRRRTTPECVFGVIVGSSVLASSSASAIFNQDLPIYPIAMFWVAYSISVLKDPAVKLIAAKKSPILCTRRAS